MKTTADKITEVTKEFGKFLLEKNKRYGDSALNPLNVFSKHIDKNNTQALNGMLIRLDDKLKRIYNADTLRENDVIDIMGYLVLVCADKGWNDFKRFLD